MLPLRTLLRTLPASRLCSNTSAATNLTFINETPSETLSEPSQVQPGDIYDKFGINEMVSVRQLFDARMHLGHKHGVSYPLMKRYIFGLRARMQIFDLDITLSHMKRALLITGLVAEKKGIILFVNGRPQFDRLVRDTATDCGEYYVSPTWHPGTFTNSQMMLNTSTLPDLVILLNSITSETVLREAAMCNIPTICLADSNSDPRLITYTVPGNDDTPSSVVLFCEMFRDVIKNAKSKQ